MFSYGLLHMDTPLLADQLRPMYISFAWTLDAVLRTNQKWWLIRTDGKGESRESILLACHDDETLLSLEHEPHVDYDFLLLNGHPPDY